jgi:hypothetical protein
MRTVRTIVERSDGRLEFIPLAELWAISGILADTFPLDRSLATAPRRARRLAHWTRLVLVDRALTNPERTAMLTLTDTPWVPAVLVAVVAAVIAPRLPRWLRLALFGGVAVWALRGGRAARYVSMRRELERVAPDALFVADFVALQPGAGMEWVADALDAVGPMRPYVALLPASGNDRRDAARERLSVRRLGFRVAGHVTARGQSLTVVVRDSPGTAQSSGRTPRNPNQESSATQSAR